MAVLEHSGERPLGAEQFRKVFAGLMLGMLVGALNLTIVSPALPRIVAELGGMNHYSWVALSTNLAAAVVIPVVGKLGDVYGRKPFYVGGLVLFMIASTLSGTAQTFWWLIGARLVQGIAVGTLMPLSQAIVGDLVPPRERGKYQGLIGTMFGVASVSGPPLGGWLTDNLSWRWMFFVSIPLGLVALRFIWRNMHLPHHSRTAQPVDWFGMLTLTPALVAILLATSWGGVQYPWHAPSIIGLYVAGAFLLAAFGFGQTRARDPLIPPYLWRNPVFTLSGLASFTLAMAMFGAIFYVPVFAQGVLGVSVARSGFLLIPLDIGIIVVAAANGFLISRTGRFKAQMLVGLPVTALGFLLMLRMTPSGAYGALILYMLLVGIGIGATMQTYTIVVQTGVPRRDLGVATSAIQFFRNVGSTVGIAVLGTMMTANVTRRLPQFLAQPSQPAPPSLNDFAGGPAPTPAPSPAPLAAPAVVDVADMMEPLGSGEGVAALFEPGRLAALPDALVQAIRLALHAAFQPLFWTCLGFLAVTYTLTMFLKPIELSAAPAPVDDNFEEAA